MQHDGGGKWPLLMCFSSQQTNSIIAATLKTAHPSIEHNLLSCVAVKEKRTRSCAILVDASNLLALT
jgi:hypothetical protein